MLKRLTDPIRQLSAVLVRISELLQPIALWAEERPYEALEERVSVLERSRAIWEADMDAILKKAESTQRAARSAEERARRMARDSDGDDDGSDEIPEAYREAVRALNGGSGQDQGVQPVPQGMGSRGPAAQERKAALTRAKWGL